MENPGYDIAEKEKDTRTHNSVSESYADTPIKLYPRRWIILFIFSLISMMNEVIWISLASVSNVVKDYYRITFHQVNWLAMIFSAVYITVVGAVFILNKFGLKVTIIAGALCNAIGAGFRLIGYTRSGYPYAFIGNTIGGIGQSFLIFVPPTLSSVWFGEEERARASAIGMLMNMSGVALGFFMGGMFVPNSTDYDGVVKQGMFRCLLTQLIICVLQLLASVALIQKEPPSPPTHSQALDLQRKKSKHDIRKASKASSVTGRMSAVIPPTPTTITQSTGFFKNLKTLMTNANFHLMTQSYGIYFGLFTSNSSLLNQVASQHFHSHVKLIGLMGAVSVIFGLVSIMLSGVWIDKTHRYKFISVCIFGSCSLSILAFHLVLKYSGNFALCFVCYCVYGFCMYPFLCVGLEYLAELMYPVKESNLSFVSFFLGTFYGVIIINCYTVIIHKFGAEYAGYISSVIYFIGFMCLCCVKGELKRYTVDKERSRSINK